MINAVTVANNFIQKGLNENIPITPLKLQKLVYFLFRRYLQQTGKELFTERFETWKYGPVIPSIYAEFMTYGDDTIKTYAQDSCGNSFVVKEDGLFKEAIEYVWETYKEFPGTALSKMTHLPNTAWSKAKEKKSQYLDVGDISAEQEFA